MKVEGTSDFLWSTNEYKVIVYSMIMKKNLIFFYHPEVFPY